MATLFISDVHVGANNPHAGPQLIRLLDGACGRIDALYILGDLFDAWVGDDDQRPPHGDVCAALRRLTQSGVSVNVVHGNHDFLIGEDFANNTGCTLISDPDVIDLYGQAVGVCHGDHLCTDDAEYQAWRQYSRNPDNQKAFLRLPFDVRLQQAAALKLKSSEATKLKAEDIMDVNESAVARAFDSLGVSMMIHGHTHRPDVHHYECERGTHTRYVLGDWYNDSHVLMCNPNDKPKVLNVDQTLNEI